MIGVLTNVGCVLAGGTIGLFLKKGIPERIASFLMKCIGLCTLFIGVTGMISDETNTLAIILSVVIGGLIGELIDIDKYITKAAEFTEKKTNKSGGKMSIAEGFVSSTLLFCVGAMTIVGSMNAGLKGDNSMLFTKSILDLISSVIFASALGFGVLFSAVSVFVIQGGICLFATWVSPLLTSEIIANMTVAGSVCIIALGLNLLEITKIKVANLLPAIILPCALCPLVSLIF